MKVTKSLFVALFMLGYCCTLKGQDVFAGRIYYDANDFEKSLAYYDRANIEHMDEQELCNYAMAAFFLGKYEKSLDITKHGLAQHPNHAAFNRLAFFNFAELKEYNEALIYADALFHKSDSADFSYLDYTYYGNVLVGIQKIDEAISMYHQALKQKDIDVDNKKATIYRQLSLAYKEKEDFPNAITHYKDYLTLMKNPSANDIAGLANLYLQHATTLENDEKTEALKLADAVYADLADRHEDAIEYATFMRARVNAQIDTEQKNGLAKPYYEKLVELLTEKAEPNNTEKSRLKESYHYLISYYLFIANDATIAEFYAQKMLIIDPDNDMAKQVMKTN